MGNGLRPVLYELLLITLFSGSTTSRSVANLVKIGPKLLPTSCVQTFRYFNNYKGGDK